MAPRSMANHAGSYVLMTYDAAASPGSACGHGVDGKEVILSSSEKVQRIAGNVSLCVSLWISFSSTFGPGF